METSGWIIMLLSVGSVLSLVTYCVARVLLLPAADIEDIEGPLTIDTGDTRDAD
jgi:hypothetical protein